MAGAQGDFELHRRGGRAGSGRQSSGGGARLAAISFGLTAVAAIFFLIWPVYTGFEDERPTHATLLQVNGWWVIVP